MKKSIVELKRVNMNLPLPLVQKVVDYAEKMGVNTTNAYIFLLNYAIVRVDLGIHRL